MIFKFSNHALTQLQRRGIEKGLVEKIILNPDNILSQDDELSVYSKVVYEGSKSYLYAFEISY